MKIWNVYKSSTSFNDRKLHGKMMAANNIKVINLKINDGHKC